MWYNPRMNKILLSQAQPLRYNGVDQLSIPFMSSDIGNSYLDEPAYNRSDYENRLAKDISERLEKALAANGYTMIGLSFTAMKVYATKA